MSIKPSLEIKTSKQAAEDAKIILDEERDGKQRGLLCRFPTMNAAMLKWWRFGNITQIASSSGAGKSYLLNALLEDFSDNEDLNKDFCGEVVILHFAFEMRASDEALRTISRGMKKSYSYLRSSERQGKIYNKLSDEEYNDAVKLLNTFSKRNILYVETSGNMVEIENTIDYVANKHKGKRLVISFDHALLIKRLEENNEIELISNLAQNTIKWTKSYDSLTIILGQLNANVEQPIRIENSFLHYPKKGDIHGSNQLYMACDNVLIWHKPEMLEIEFYGRKGIKTKNLVHGNLIKSRFGKPGHLWFISELHEGGFRELTVNELAEKNIIPKRLN